MTRRLIHMRTIAIDLGGTAVKLGRFDDDRLTASHEIELERGELSLDALADAVDRFVQTAGTPQAAVSAPPDAIGIAVPGIVDPAGTRLIAAHGKYAALHDVDLVAWSAARLGAPAIVENDARAALVGETSSGVARGARDAVLLTLGTGIGTAALVDGRPLRGPHGHAGILGGHVTVELDGPHCPCGNVGCAEAIASTWALREAAARGDLELGPALGDRFARTGTLGIRDLVETRDEPRSAAILDRFIDVWAAVVVTQCHAFDPEVVVVTGGVLRSADALLPALRERVHAHLWSSSFRPPLVTPDDPSTSVLRGLAALATARTEAITTDPEDHR
jgi:glucokinase